MHKFPKHRFLSVTDILDRVDFSLMPFLLCLDLDLSHLPYCCPVFKFQLYLFCLSICPHIIITWLRVKYLSHCMFFFHFHHHLLGQSSADTLNLLQDRKSTWVLWRWSLSLCVSRTVCVHLLFLLKHAFLFPQLFTELQNLILTILKLFIYFFLHFRQIYGSKIYKVLTWSYNSNYN